MADIIINICLKYEYENEYLVNRVFINGLLAVFFVVSMLIKRVKLLKKNKHFQFFRFILFDDSYNGIS